MQFSQTNKWLLRAAGFIVLLSINSAEAQDTQFWNTSGPDDWNIDENWINRDVNINSGVPDIDFGDSAGFDNNGTANVAEAVPNIGALSITSGMVDIQQGGSLTVDDSDETSGSTTIGDRGILRLSGDGALETGGLASSGTIELVGTGAGLSTRGDFSNSGVLTFDVSGDGNASINVGGTATLGGTIAPVFDGVSPNLGDSYEFISGADAVINNGATLMLPESVSLERGLGALVSTSGGSASISIGNLPILSVHRVTGETKIMNVVGDPMEITGYSVFSESGLLSVDNWSSLEDQQIDGWAKANPRAEAVAELSLSSIATVTVGGDPVGLGNLYNGGAVHPDDEDVQFEVSLADGSVVGGVVEYEGAPNNLALRVDPATGEAEISHQSSFIDPLDVTGYSILSESGALLADNWTSLFDGNNEGWLEANPSANALAEINPSNSTVFSTGTEFALGQIVAPGGGQDLMFEFTTADGARVLAGTVVYGSLDGGVVMPPPAGIAGDIDGDGNVGFSDFLILSANFGLAGGAGEGDIDGDGSVGFPDFLTLSANFGQSAGAVAAVPEPGALGSLCVGVLVLLSRRRRSR